MMYFIEHWQVECFLQIENSLMGCCKRDFTITGDIAGDTPGISELGTVLNVVIDLLAVRGHQCRLDIAALLPYLLTNLLL